MTGKIPRSLAEDADVQEGVVLNLAVAQGKVVSTPGQQRKLSLKQLLAKVHKNNLRREVDFGPSVGREIW